MHEQQFSPASDRENAVVQLAALRGTCRGLGEGSGPSDFEQCTEIRLPLDPRAPAAARIVVAEVLAEGVTPVVLEGAKLAISELVSNSVEHSGARAGQALLIRVGRVNGGFWLEVEDPGDEGTVAPRVPDEQAGGGFGLHLVEYVSERWGVDRQAQPGTRVWAEFSNTPSAVGPYYGDATAPLNGTPVTQNGKHTTAAKGLP
jgi:anti-sigma regulatory factor (Ser/Thr protein kinase)